MPDENINPAGEVVATATPVVAAVTVPIPDGAGWSQRWQLPVFVLALVAWGLFLVDTHRQLKAAEEEPAVAAGRIQALYEAGFHERVLRDAGIFAAIHPDSEERGVVEYLGGRSAFVLARALPERSEDYYRRVGELLERALNHDLEEKFAIDAMRTLGEAALAMGEYNEAIEWFDQLQIRYPGRAEDVLVLKAEAEFGFGPAQSELAMQTIENYLMLEDLDESDRVSALLVAARGFRRNDLCDRALAACARIVDQHPSTLKLNEVWFEQGMALMSPTGRSKERLKGAQEAFGKALAHAVRNEELDRRSRFCIGECDYVAGDYDAAYPRFRLVAQVDSGTPEGTAASLRLAAILVYRKDYRGAREAMNDVLIQVPRDGKFSNAYVSEGEVNEIWSSILKQYLDQKDYTEVETMIGDGKRLAARGVYFFGQATAYKLHAAGLAAKAEELRERGLDEQWKPLAEEAAGYYAIAADLYARIVNSADDEGASGLYGQSLYNAGLCYFQAGDHPRCVVYSRMFIDTSTRNANKEQTEVRYGLSLQAMGRHREAISHLESIQPDLGMLNNTPEAYEAMLAIPISYMALDQWEKAEEGLSRIVAADKRFSPEKSRVWQKALGELAYALYRKGKFSEAVYRWDELLCRPKALARSRFSELEVCYYLADSFRGIQSYDPKKRADELELAVKWFSRVEQLAADRPVDDVLALQMVRMSHLNEADCLFELGHHYEALRAYRVTSEKYPESVEGLGALFGMAACLDRMDSGAAAAQAAARALWTLEKARREHPERITAFHEALWMGRIGGLAKPDGK